MGFNNRSYGTNPDSWLDNPKQAIINVFVDHTFHVIRLKPRSAATRLNISLIIKHYVTVRVLTRPINFAISRNSRPVDFNLHKHKREADFIQH